MKKTNVIIFFILLIILIIVLLFAFGVIGTGGYKATVHGTAYYDIINGWGVTFNSATVENDGILSFYPGFYWPWETKDINIIAEITNNNQNYESSIWIGSSSIIVGSKNFDTVFRHLPVGSYSGSIYLYEVDKGFWGVFEKNRVLQATCSLSFNIVGG